MVWAQQEKEKPPPLTEGLPQRELSEEERREREEKLLKELERTYKKWLEEDVRYIITAEEREAFLHLNSNEEREQFIEQFWLRRDPTPTTIENEYREEHYRRIAYANEKFSVGRPGWKSDRGRIYIIHGPPDSIESHPAGSLYQSGAGIDTLGKPTPVRAFERWRYHYIEGIGSNVVVEFVDRNGDGDYKLMLDPTEKEIFTRAGPLTRATEPLLETPFARASRGDTSKFALMERMNLYAVKLQDAPEVQFKDLEALVDTRISFNLLPFQVRTDFIRVTSETVLVLITVSIEKADLTFQMKQGLQQAVVNIFGRVSTLTRRNVQTFEDVVQLDVPPALLKTTLDKPALYQKAVPLRPGLYKLNLVLKDLSSSNVGTLERRLAVPRFHEDELAHSSLILADQIEAAGSRNLGTGPFVIGDTKVRPVVEANFGRNQKLGIYFQVYNLGVDQATNQPDATITYTVMQNKQPVFQRHEHTSQIQRPGQQLTVAKFLPLEPFPPGKYRLMISVSDRIRQHTLETSTTFRVRP